VPFGTGGVLAEVIKNGHVLQYASELQKRDREIVLAAVTQDGVALQFASDDLKDDKGIVLAAVKNISVHCNLLQMN